MSDSDSLGVRPPFIQQWGLTAAVPTESKGSLYSHMFSVIFPFNLMPGQYIIIVFLIPKDGKGMAGRELVYLVLCCAP
jgi:hypothetical protein